MPVRDTLSVSLSIAVGTRLAREQGDIMAVTVGSNYWYTLTLCYTTLHNFTKIFTTKGPHNREIHRSKYLLTKNTHPAVARNSHPTFVAQKKNHDLETKIKFYCLHLTFCSLH
jgi:hypothetical protein